MAALTAVRPTQSEPEAYIRIAGRMARSGKLATTTSSAVTTTGEAKRQVRGTAPPVGWASRIAPGEESGDSYSL